MDYWLRNLPVGCEGLDGWLLWTNKLTLLISDRSLRETYQLPVSNLLDGGMTSQLAERDLTIVMRDQPASCQSPASWL